MNKKFTFNSNLLFSLSIIAIGFYLILGISACKTKSAPMKIEEPIDSLKLRRMELVKKFDCDTSCHFDILDFTFRVNESLKELKKPILVRVDIDDIYQQNDSILLMVGECLDPQFITASFIFQVDKSKIHENFQMYMNSFCVIENISLQSPMLSEAKSEDSRITEGILNANCIYIEKLN